MNEYSLLVNVAWALLAALVGGLTARLFRLPVMVGYLAAGIVVGPNTPGIFANQESMYAVAKLGAALLMFSVGVQLSIKDMNAIRATALGGGAIQIAGTIMLGVILGVVFGWGVYGGLFLGCAMSITSTTIMMRVLEERGEVGEAHNSVMLGISVVQDLSLVAMVALLPALAKLSTEGFSALNVVAISLIQAVVLVSVTLLLALRIVPYILEGVARAGIRELFVLMVVFLCLVAAYGAYLAGLSLEIGAFLAGMVISESRYAHEVLSQVRPLRDVFVSLFFVSVGMLLDPVFLMENIWVVLVVVAAILIGKGLISALAIYLYRWNGRTVIMGGMGLAQIGEFSFVLGVIGSERGLIPDEISGVILSAALITILVAPFFYGWALPLYKRLNTFPGVARMLNRYPEDISVLPNDNGPAARVIVLGSGRVGRHISDTLRTKGVSQIVVDYNTRVVEIRRAMGIPVIFGDASSDVVLSRTNPEQAELAVVTLPDPGATEAAIRRLKHLAPNLPVLTRVHRGADIPKVREAGANGVVHAEFEASMRLTRITMERLGYSRDEIDDHVRQLRMRRYRDEPEGPQLASLHDDE